MVTGFYLYPPLLLFSHVLYGLICAKRTFNYNTMQCHCLDHLSNDYKNLFHLTTTRCFKGPASVLQRQLCTLQSRGDHCENDERIHTRVTVYYTIDNYIQVRYSYVIPAFLWFFSSNEWDSVTSVANEQSQFYVKGSQTAMKWRLLFN